MQGYRISTGQQQMQHLQKASAHVNNTSSICTRHQQLLKQHTSTTDAASAQGISNYCSETAPVNKTCSLCTCTANAFAATTLKFKALTATAQKLQNPQHLHPQRNSRSACLRKYITFINVLYCMS